MTQSIGNFKIATRFKGVMGPGSCRTQEILVKNDSYRSNWCVFRLRGELMTPEKKFKDKFPALDPIGAASGHFHDSIKFYVFLSTWT